MIFPPAPVRRQPHHGDWHIPFSRHVQVILALAEGGPVGNIRGIRVKALGPVVDAAERDVPVAVDVEVVLTGAGGKINAVLYGVLGVVTSRQRSRTRELMLLDPGERCVYRRNEAEEVQARVAVEIDGSGLVRGAVGGIFNPGRSGRGIQGRGDRETGDHDESDEGATERREGTVPKMQA